MCVNYFCAVAPLKHNSLRSSQYNDSVIHITVDLVAEYLLQSLIADRTLIIVFVCDSVLR